MASTDVKIPDQDRTYKYSLRDRIGRGSFGDVYKGFLETVSLNNYELETNSETWEIFLFEIITILTVIMMRIFRVQGRNRSQLKS